MMKISILQTNGAAALVEWSEAAGVHRAVIPVNEIVDGTVKHETLAAGVPYGEPWEMLPLGQVGAERIAQALRAHGIWTAADAQNVNRVRAALFDAYGADVATILNAIRKR